MTWAEAAIDCRGQTLIIPLGSTEQHGPHLPIGTDTIIAAAWADRVAIGLGHAVVSPALPFGSAGEHRHFPGTLSIGGPGLHMVMVELARSAAETYPRLAFLSGHAGNAGPIGRAVEQLRSEGHDVIARLATWPDGTVEAPIDAHAGRTETSLLLHLRPDLVRLDRAEAGDTRPVGQMMDVLSSDGVAAVSANGVLGDPAGANPDEGRVLLDDLVARTTADLRAWTNGERGEPNRAGLDGGSGTRL